MIRFRRILHPTDFSPASTGAFRLAIRLARASGAHLTIAHVHAPLIPPAGGSYAMPQAYDVMRADIRAEAGRRLDRLVAQAGRAGVRARGVLLEGVADDRIVRAARAWRADLIVLGTHGRTGVGRVLLGSIAWRVIALATCPVLTVRGSAPGTRPVRSARTAAGRRRRRGPAARRAGRTAA